MEEATIDLVRFLRVLGVCKGKWSKVALRMMADKYHILKIKRRIYRHDAFRIKHN